MPNIQFQFRRGTSTEWSIADPVLASGEMGIETDTNQFKIGNGNDSWNNLSYGGIQGGPGPSGAVGATGIQGATGPIGLPGATGATGTGFVGSRGATGLLGATGATGVGFVGSRGATGLTGAAGQIGSTGATGVGFVGSMGATGVIGYTGSAGNGSANIVARRYTANGSSSVFSITENLTTSSIFVFKDGAILEPGLDYVVSNDRLILDQTPAAGSLLQIREFLNSTGFISGLSLPKITSITITNDQYISTGASTIKTNGGYIKISGQNFDVGATLQIGANLITAISVVSSTEIQSEVPPLPEGSYDLKIKNIDSSFDKKINILRVTSAVVNDTWIYSTSIIDSASWGNSKIRDVYSAVSNGDSIVLNGSSPLDVSYRYLSQSDVNSILGNVEVWTGDQKFPYYFSDLLWDGEKYYGVGNGFLRNNGNPGIFKSNSPVSSSSFTSMIELAKFPYTIAVNDAKDKYVVGGDLGLLVVSSNGDDWALNNSFDTNGWSSNATETSNKDKVNKILWSDNKFIAFGDNGKIATSNDGEVWTYSTSLRETGWGTSANILTASKSISSGLIFIGGENGSFATSQDGNAWISYTGLSNDPNWGNININKVVSKTTNVNNTNIERVIALGDQLKIAYTDDFGGTWVIPNTIYDTLYIDESNNWVTYIDLPDNEILAFGTNGITARIRSNLEIINIESLRNSEWKSTSILDCTAIGWNGSQFITGSDVWIKSPGQVRTYIASSSDGIIWNNIQEMPGEKIEQIFWDGTKTIALSWFGTINYSTDGTNWSINTSSTRLDRSDRVVHAGGQYSTNLIMTHPRIAYNGSIYVALGRNFVLCTSTNGLDWTLRGIFAGLNLNTQIRTGVGQSLVGYNVDVIWAGNFESGKFLAVGHGMFELFESTDGINWTLRATNLSSFNWAGLFVSSAIFEKIIWTKTQFFIITSFGSVLQSNDGTTWNLHRTLEQNTTDWGVPGQDPNVYPFDRVRTRAAIWDGEKLILTNTVHSKIAVSYDGIDWNISEKLFDTAWDNSTVKGYQNGALDIIKDDGRTIIVGKFGKVASGNIN